MRKTELTLGLIASISGLVLTALSFMGVTHYLEDTLAASACSGYILLGANILGIIGALSVMKHHIAGSVMMLLATTSVMLFGFPWQSISAVVYIMAVVLALVPVKYEMEKK